MIVDLEKIERDLLIDELEETTIPNLRIMIASGGHKDLRDDLKKDEETLKNLLKKLKSAA